MSSQQNLRRPRHYPSQYEAELIIASLDALNSIQLGSATQSHAARIITEAKRAMAKEYHRVFNSPDTSPWELRLRGIQRRGSVLGSEREIGWRESW